MQLKRRIDSTPQDLEDCILHMMDQIYPRHQREAYTLLALVLAYTKVGSAGHGNPLCITASGASSFINCFHELERDRVKGIDTQLATGCFDIPTTDTYVPRAEQLNGRYNGLLELQTRSFDLYGNSGGEFIVELGTVGVTHRSIVETLQKYLRARLCRQDTTALDISRWACHIAHYEFVKVLPGKYEQLRKDFTRNRITSLLHVLVHIGCMKHPYVLEHLHHIETVRFTFWGGSRVPYSEPVTVVARNILLIGWTPSILVFAALRGPPESLEYVIYATRGKAVTSNRTLVSQLLLSLHHWQLVDTSAAVNSLLQESFSSLDDATHELGRKVIRDALRNWTGVIYNGPKEPDMVNMPWSLVEVWLSHGVNSQSKVAKQGAWIHIYEPERFEWRTKDSDEIWSDDPLQAVLNEEVVTMTLRDVVAYERPYNMERLLELIDRNMLRIEAEEAAENVTMFGEMPSPEVLEAED
ncbi:Uu.00g106570.m01.CDS01 [Anthostomella pinea]|uniref:Uu.00g106570.m01.CDS01 n=1 Tax=Anthostomella pinea TaxID=933095 RepID=A0AAI8VF54_9PEZI|nr:Uu.00g106570.m01.CDS01 [Anthostomella pinea]